MPKALELTGARFGRLTAQSRERSAERGGNAVWLCLCDCGRTITAPTSNLRSGNTTSCGCARSEKTSKRCKHDLSGHRFGRLTVISESPRRGANNEIFWACVCDCGNNVTVLAGNLKKGNTASCGCLQKEWCAELKKRNTQDNPISSTPEYKRAAQKRRMQNPSVLMARRIRWTLWRSIAKHGSFKRSKTFETLGYTPDDLKQHLEKQMLPGMSWDNVGEWHIDHITPISTATSFEDIVALNQLSNLRPLWKADNLAKAAKTTHLI